MRPAKLPKLLARSAGVLPRFVIFGAVVLGSGCLYRMPIQQGNFLAFDQVSQLQPGMTRPQVKFLLGTPMVPNGFNEDRWDYYYYVNMRRMAKPYTQRLTVWFKDDKVDHIDKSAEFPETAPPETVAPSAKAVKAFEEAATGAKPQ
jgi:outer membrane protein assembly factor BamE